MEAVQSPDNVEDWDEFIKLYGVEEYVRVRYMEVIVQQSN